MLKKKYIQINVFLIIIVLGLISIPNYSLGIENAYQLFKEKKYEEALPIFITLRKENPNDISLDYYTGVCLTETNQYGKESIDLLLKASSSEKPVDVFFYLAKNYHALNDFKMAKSYYTIFDQKASNKEKKGFDLNNKINLCERSINPFPHFQTPNPGNEVLTSKYENSDISLSGKTSPTLSKDVVYQDSVAGGIDTVNIKDFSIDIPSTLDDSMINFILTSEIYYTRFYQFRTTEGKQNYVRGWNFADSLTSLMRVTDSLRNEYGKTLSSEAKSQISNKVIDLEDRIMKTKSLSDESYYKANEYELSYWQHAPEEEKLKLMSDNDSIKNAEITKHNTIPIPTLPVDTIQIADSVATDTIAIEPIAPLTETPKTSLILFKIQIGKYNTDLPESTKKLFKKISVLRKIDQYTDEKGFVVYTIGELTNLKDAVKLQDQIRQESVKDAFVIAIKDGKRIPLNEAVELLKQ